MYPRLPTPDRIFFIGILVAGIIGGVIFLTPKLDGNNFLGGGLGFLIAVFLSHLIFPEIREMSKITWNKRLRISIINSFTHPTQLPTTIAMLWFTVSLLSMFVLKLKVTTEADESRLIGLVFIPMLLLIGFSGYRILTIKETVGKFGEIHTGCMVYVNGVLALVIGWGGVIFLVLALLFNW